MQIKTIVLMTNNFSACKEFYVRFGLSISSEDNGFAEFSAGNMNLAILDEHLSYDLAGKDHISFNSHKDFLINIEVDDVDATISLLAQKGISVYKGPTLQPRGQKVAYVTDPDNNIIELGSWPEKKTITGCIISESLHNPLLLNNLDITKTVIESQPDTDRQNTIRHVFTITCPKDTFFAFAQKLEQTLQDTRYAHFWDTENLYVIVGHKTRTIKRIGNSFDHNQLEACKNYAMQHGVEEKYLDFVIEG